MIGLLNHFLLSLRLNLRSKQALVYGYLVPIFFLLAFGSVFRSGIPPLLREMGQLLTIGALGGACFGMPTAMVAERERGVWRRYRLLPAASGGLVASTMLARLIIIGSAAVMQIILARIAYGTPLPLHPFQLLVVFSFVGFAFMGMGLLIAALADNVPAVQALGQAVFLPMIMIGGVGVPLHVLPAWAQTVAGFLPGRYAVESLQACFEMGRVSHAILFDLLALTVIGVAACVAGIKLFRWDVHQHVNRSAKIWVTIALLAWIAVGAVAYSTGRLKVTQISNITFDNLPPDDGTITPLAPAVEGIDDANDRDRLNTISQKLGTWPLAHPPNSVTQRVRNLLSVAAIADVTEDPLEGRIARVVFNHLLDHFERDELIDALKQIILEPQAGTVMMSAPELDLDGKVTEEIVRNRDGIYARKFLGRLLGKIPDQE